MCVCNFYSKRRPLGLKDRGEVVLYLTRSCDYIRIKYSVFVKSNSLNIQILNTSLTLFLSLYRSTIYNSLLLISKFYFYFLNYISFNLREDYYIIIFYYLSRLSN